MAKETMKKTDLQKKLLHITDHASANTFYQQKRSGKKS